MTLVDTCIYLPYVGGVVGCKDTEDGVNYIGAQNITDNNRPCLQWNEMVFWTAFGYLKYDAVW